MARSLLGELAGLVVPITCAGCGAVDVGWCATCATALHDVQLGQDAWRLDRVDGAPVLPVWTAGRYAGPVRSAIPAWKDKGRLDLTPVMADAVRRTVRVAAPALVAIRDPDATGPGELLVVPAPSRAAARRRRAVDVVEELADAVVDELGLLAGRGVGPSNPIGGDPGMHCQVRRAVVLRRRGGRDPSGLGARDRGRIAATIEVSRGVAPGACAVLVDDVVTTGATLAACHDALARAGVRVLAAFAVARTPGSPA